MTLQEFQYIYAWEYGHRMFGRVIGLAFVGPWMYYTVRKRIPIGYQSRMALLGTMGLTQGLVGWWMVKSGLGDDRRNDRKEIRVTPFRLTTHLSMAVATYGTLLWTALDILKLPHNSFENFKSSITSSSSSTAIKDALQRTKQFRIGAIGITGLTAVTIVSGALVAGNDAGRAYNTFPKMDEEWIPTEIMELTPWYRNFIENTATVQFNHRILGSTVACSALALASIGLRKQASSQLLLTPQVRKGLYAIGITATGQAALGITTLLTYVPISLAAIHQMGSLAVFTSGIYLVHSLKYVAVATATKASAGVKKSATAAAAPILKSALRNS
jgi:cytochrome c oxidase assembly protein subunit 15